MTIIENVYEVKLCQYILVTSSNIQFKNQISLNFFCQNQ